MKIRICRTNKAIVVVLVPIFVLSMLYISNIRILGGDNWITYGFARGIANYGLEAYSTLSIHYKSYATYYPCVLWAVSHFINLDPMVVDLAIFFVLFPSMAILTYVAINEIIEDRNASVVATLLFLFGGGSAWIAHLLYAGDFWTASYFSLDANFGDAHLISGLWVYKGLSLFLALSSTLLFTRIHLSEGKRSRIKSILYYVMLPLCISLSILCYPYGILFTIGTTMVMSFFLGLIKTKKHNKLQLKRTLAVLFTMSTATTLVVLSTDILLGNILEGFIESRLTRFYGLSLNAYVVIFTAIFSGLVLSLYLFVSGFRIASYLRNHNPLSNEKKFIFGIMVFTTLVLVFFGIASWLANPEPQEYLLTLMKWPLKYTVSRYSFILLLGVFISSVTYSQGYIHVALVNMLSVTLVIIAGTLVPLPVKMRTFAFIKLALVIGVGYGICKIIKTYGCTKQSAKRNGYRLVLVCMSILLLFSLVGGGYFWGNILQGQYPANEIEISNWILSNTPTDINLRFLTTPEWSTIRLTQWLAAKPNTTPIRLNETEKAVNILIDNVKEYGSVYIVIDKYSETAERLHNLVCVLERSDLIVEVYENDAYLVYITTSKLDRLMEQSENLTHPLEAISENPVLYESFDSYTALGIHSNAVFLNDTALIIENNLTFRGEFALSFWLEVESKGEILFMDFDSGYVRIRSSDNSSLMLILHHENAGDQIFIPIKTKYKKWVHLVIQAEGNRLNFYHNGTPISTIEHEIVFSVANSTLKNIKISDKLWWEAGFQGFVDELTLANVTLPYDDVLLLYEFSGNS